MIITKKDFEYSGIYKIVNILNNKFYIGSAVSIYNRFYTHRYHFKNNSHQNKHLQKAWNKYGEEAFELVIVEIVEDKNRLLGREQYYLDSLKPEYNLVKTAGSNLGLIRSESSKIKQSLALKGRKQTKEHIYNRFLNRKRTFSEAAKLKMKGRGLGVKRTKESIEKQILKNLKVVLQFDCNMNLIKKWVSVKEAKEFYKDTAISQYCLNKKKDRRGFIWMHEDKYKLLPEIQKTERD